MKKRLKRKLAVSMGERTRLACLEAMRLLSSHCLPGVSGCFVFRASLPRCGIEC